MMAKAHCKQPVAADLTGFPAAAGVSYWQSLVIDSQSLRLLERTPTAGLLGQANRFINR